MKRRCLAPAMALGILVVFGVSLLSAGATYEVTLDSGATYTVEKVDADTYNVANSSGELVGHLKSGGAGGGYEVFDANDNLLGSAAHINPDALEILDQHVGGGA